jgi:histidinol-phosphate aminotransferase
MSNVAVSRRTLIGGAAGLLAIPALSPWAQEWIGGGVHGQASAAHPTFLDPDGSPTNEDQTFPIRILFNENPLGCSPAAAAAVRSVVNRANFYPFDIASLLNAKLRAKHGLPELPVSLGLSLKPSAEAHEHTLALAGGSSELLLAAALAYCVEGGNVVEPAPSYQAVGSAAASRPGPEVERRFVPLNAKGGLDADQMLAACDAKTRILVVTNPNNPTGTKLAAEDLTKLITKAPSHTLVFVDEAYIDFLDNPESHSAVPLALRSENVLVVRTFSKIHGLAALRAGYGIGHRSIFERMRPFQVGSLSLNACGLTAAMASLDDVDFQSRSRAMAADSRRRITKQLNSLGFVVSDSQAACLWADWGREVEPLVAGLSDRGVLISSGMRWDSPTCVRISVGTPWQTSRLLEAITDLV